LTIVNLPFTFFTVIIPKKALTCIIKYDWMIVSNFVALRLVGRSLFAEGRLEIYYNGQWGTVCDNYFDDNDASVACFQLRFS